MKLSFALLATLFAAVRAGNEIPPQVDRQAPPPIVVRPQDMIPRCAMPCVEAYVATHTECKGGDYTCICGHKEIKDETAIKCAVNACGYRKAKGM